MSKRTNIPSTPVSSEAFARMLGERIAEKLVERMAENYVEKFAKTPNFESAVTDYAHRALLETSDSPRTADTDDPARDVVTFLGRMLREELARDGGEPPVRSE